MSMSKKLSEILSAFELMDGRTQKIVNTVAGKKMPLEGEYPFYCLIETSGSNTDHDSEVMFPVPRGPCAC